VINFKHVLVVLSVIAPTIFLSSGAAEATGLYSGTVDGIFTNPKLFGNTYVDGILIFRNDKRTAVYTGFGTNSITWGDTTPGLLGPNEISFQGKAFSNIAADTPFDIGTITYLNGVTKTGNTLIFGGTLLLSTGGVADVLSVDIKFLNTGFTKTHSVAAPDNADFVTFSDLANTSFNILEQNTATAEVFGMIVGDPQLTLTSIQLISDGTTGFIGNGTPNPVPEPASLLLLSVGLVGLGVLRRRSLP
jgi:hypothetical protein